MLSHQGNADMFVYYLVLVDMRAHIELCDFKQYISFCFIFTYVVSPWIYED